jgi:hypothetical protein
MDDLDVELLTTQLTGTAFSLCQEREMRLTDQAKRLVRLTAEAIIKEPPRSAKQEFRTDVYKPGAEFWLSAGTAILGLALEDERVTKEMESRKRVSFPTLMRALTDATHIHLQSVGFKD